MLTKADRADLAAMGMHAFYVVEDATGRIPDEHYCAEHLIGETEYLAKHNLKDSGDIWLNPQPGCPEPDEYEEGEEDYVGVCDEPGCCHGQRA